MDATPLGPVFVPIKDKTPIVVGTAPAVGAPNLFKIHTSNFVRHRGENKQTYYLNINSDPNKAVSGTKDANGNYICSSYKIRDAYLVHDANPAGSGGGM